MMPTLGNNYAPVAARIRLTRIDEPLARVLGDGASAVESAYGVRLEVDLDHARELVRQNMAWLTEHPRPDPWGAYLSVSEDSSDAVGVGAFVHAPTVEGEVEIAYGTFPRFEKRGFGLATAACLLALASAQREARRVIAHTAPEAGASTRILEKLGLRYVGEATDRDIGLCWRWAIALPQRAG